MEQVSIEQFEVLPTNSSSEVTLKHRDLEWRMSAETACALAHQLQRAAQVADDVAP